MQFINQDRLEDLHEWLNRIFYSLSGYSVFLWAGNFIKYDIVKFILACITAICIGACGEFGKKVVFPYLNKRYSLWKRSRK